MAAEIGWFAAWCIIIVLYVFLMVDAFIKDRYALFFLWATVMFFLIYQATESLVAIAEGLLKG